MEYKEYKKRKVYRKHYVYDHRSWSQQEPIKEQELEYKYEQKDLSRKMREDRLRQTFIKYISNTSETDKSVDTTNEPKKEIK